MTLTSTQVLATQRVDNSQNSGDVQSSDAFAGELIAQNFQTGASSQIAQNSQTLVAKPLEETAPFLAETILGIQNPRADVGSSSKTERQKQMLSDMLQASGKLTEISARYSDLMSFERRGDGAEKLKAARDNALNEVIDGLKSKYSEDELKGEMSSVYKTVAKETDAIGNLLNGYFKNRTFEQFPESWQKHLGDLQNMNFQGSQINNGLMNLAEKMGISVNTLRN